MLHSLANLLFYVIYNHLKQADGSICTWGKKKGISRVFRYKPRYLPCSLSQFIWLWTWQVPLWSVSSAWMKVEGWLGLVWAWWISSAHPHFLLDWHNWIPDEVAHSPSMAAQGIEYSSLTHCDRRCARCPCNVYVFIIVLH